MKKMLLTAALLIAVSFSAAAESLYRQLPAGTAAAVRVRIEKLLAEPLFKALAEESADVKQAMKKIENFSTEKTGREVTIREALFSFVDEKRWNVFMECGGLDEAFFRSSILREYPQAEETTVNGRPAFRLAPRTKDTPAMTVALLRDDLIAAGAANDLAAALKAPRMNAKAADQLERADELVTLDILDCSKINELLGDQQTEPLFRTLRGAGSVVGDQALKLHLEALCTSADAAQMVAMQAQQLMMIGVTFGLSADPELAQQILQRLKIKATEANVDAELELTREMLSRLAGYEKKAQEQRRKLREQRKQRQLEPTAK